MKEYKYIRIGSATITEARGNSFNFKINSFVQITNPRQIYTSFQEAAKFLNSSLWERGLFSGSNNYILENRIGIIKNRCLLLENAYQDSKDVLYLVYIPNLKAEILINQRGLKFLPKLKGILSS